VDSVEIAIELGNSWFSSKYIRYSLYDGPRGRALIESWRRKLSNSDKLRILGALRKSQTVGLSFMVKRETAQIVI